MTHSTRAWQRWLALATIAFAALWCCCDRADAQAAQTTHACCTQKHAAKPVTCPMGSTCAFTQLRANFALPDAITQIAPPVLFVESSPMPRLMLLGATTAVFNRSTHHPPPTSLLDLHCSLLC